VRNLFIDSNNEPRLLGLTLMGVNPKLPFLLNDKSIPFGIAILPARA